MKDIKLAKSSKIIRLPYATGSVSAIFHKAVHKANNQEWDKVIVIGQSKNRGHYFCSEMSDNDALGILETVKHLINKDRFE